MTGRITVAGAQFFAAQVFGRTQNPAESFWLALVCRIQPTVFNSGTELDEPDGPGTGYERQQILNNAGHWMTDSNMQQVNSQIITFPAAVTDWGLIKYWALTSEETDGDVYAFGEVINAVDVNPLDQVVIGPGQLAIAMNVLYQAG